MAENNIDTINQEVTNAVNELPESNQGGLLGIKELLAQLQTVIQADDSLQPEDKASALKQVQVLAFAGKNAQLGENQKQAQTAIEALRNKSAELPKTTTLITSFNQVIPQIAEIFGVE